MKRLDWAQLLGFDAVGHCDFKDETVGARVGAKVGAVEAETPPQNRADADVDFSRLLGFGTVAGELSEGVDLKNGTFGDKLGAKIGLEPAGARN